MKRINLSIFRAYKDEFKNLRIKTSFVVPNKQGWKDEFRGNKLGLYAKEIRTNLK